MKKNQKYPFGGFVIALLFFYVMLIPSLGDATQPDFYAGVTFVQEGTGKYCVIVRFKSSEFSLSKSDALYGLIVNYMGQASQIDWQSHILPSQNYANGITGESLVQAFLQYGTGVCTINKQPVDQVGLLSLYPCDYQGASHMCIRTYVHTGNLNLEALGVPYGKVAGLGAVVITTPIWNAVTSQVISNPPRLPLSISSAIDNLILSIKNAKNKN